MWYVSAHGGYLDRLFDAAIVANIRLDDVYQLLFDHLAEAPLGESALAGGDVHRQAGFAQQPQTLDIVGRHRFLVEQQVIRLQGLAQPDARRRTQPPVDVTH